MTAQTFVCVRQSDLQSAHDFLARFHNFPDPIGPNRRCVAGRFCRAQHLAAWLLAAWPLVPRAVNGGARWRSWLAGPLVRQLRPAAVADVADLCVGLVGDGYV